MGDDFDGDVGAGRQRNPGLPRYPTIAAISHPRYVFDMVFRFNKMGFLDLTAPKNVHALAGAAICLTNFFACCNRHNRTIFRRAVTSRATLEWSASSLVDGTRAIKKGGAK
jgi:hypothetical protein